MCWVGIHADRLMLQQLEPNSTITIYGCGSTYGILQTSWSVWNKIYALIVQTRSAPDLVQQYPRFYPFIILIHACIRSTGAQKFSQVQIMIDLAQTWHLPNGTYDFELQFDGSKDVPNLILLIIRHHYALNKFMHYVNIPNWLKD